VEESVLSVELKALLSGAAVKRLSATEIDPATSRSHSFQGSGSLRRLLGDQEFHDEPCRFIHLEDRSPEPGIELGLLSWTDVRRSNPNRSAEFRLYYSAKMIQTVARLGDLLVLVRPDSGSSKVIIIEGGSSWDHFFGWLLELEDSPDDSSWLDADTTRAIDFSLATELAAVLNVDLQQGSTDGVEEVLGRVLERRGIRSPEFLLETQAAQVSVIAREVASILEPTVTADRPDEAIILWMNTEEQIFRLAESSRHQERVKTGFANMDSFVNLALSVINTRKSRSGRALENHLGEILQSRGITFSTQEVTERRSLPDFVVPGIEQYRDPDFPAGELHVIAAKRTCKDRWRQVLAEAARVPVKHLLTIQAPISENQIEEMVEAGVVPVVPASLHDAFTPGAAARLLTVEELLRRISPNKVG
jgi:EcoRII C terminal